MKAEERMSDTSFARKESLETPPWLAPTCGSRYILLCAREWSQSDAQNLRDSWRKQRLRAGGKEEGFDTPESVDSAVCQARQEKYVGTRLVHLALHIHPSLVSGQSEDLVK